MAYEDLLDELKADDIPLDKIYLDPNNPRFTGSDWQYIPDGDATLPQVQEAARLKLVREFGVDKLRMNMVVNGYLPIDRVVVRALQNDDYVVLEGNRRICAAKMISRYTKEGTEVLPRVLESLKIIPCLIYTGTEKDASWIIQGLRHISGVVDWSAFNKARLLVEQMEKENLNLTEVGQCFGLTAFGAGQWMRGFYAFRQAKERSDYIREVDEKLYPYLQELFGRSSIKVREWMEWSEADFEFKNELNFNEFLGWFFPRPGVELDQGNQEALGEWEYRFIKRRDDIRQLAYLISEAPSSFEEFRREHNIELSYVAAIAKQQQEAANEKYDPVETVYGTLRDCTRSLENIPLRMIRDPNQRDKLIEALKPLEEAIKTIRESM